MMMYIVREGSLCTNAGFVFGYFDVYFVFGDEFEFEGLFVREIMVTLSVVLLEFSIGIENLIRFFINGIVYWMNI